jgi:hypothetical protein
LLLLQVLAGAVAGGLVALLLALVRVDVCEEGWAAAPAALLAAAVLLVVPAVRFASVRLALGTFAVIIAGLGAWVLFLGSALGCD